MRHRAAVALLLAAALPAAAQDTCYTDAQGTTICSTTEGVVQGGTDSVGSSVYRDRLGDRLPMQTDPTGKASVQLPSGKDVRWSAPVLGEKAYPYSRPATPAGAVPGGPPPVPMLEKPPNP